MTPRRRGDLAARAAAVTAHATGTDPDAPTRSTTTRASASTTRAPRTRPVRITVDLAPLAHRELRAWCAEAAEALEVPVVPAADVVRVLVDLVAHDPDLADRVRAALADRLG